MCNKNKSTGQMVDDRIALKKVSYYRTLVMVDLDGTDKMIPCWFCLAKNYTDDSLWIAKLVVLDYDFNHGRGQEIVKRALTRLRLPNMHELSKMGVLGFGSYIESFVDVYAKNFIDEGNCSCVFDVTINEYDAVNLIMRLADSDLPGELKSANLGSWNDDHRRKQEKKLERIVDIHESTTIVNVKMEKYHGLENLQNVITVGRLGKLDDGPKCRCVWTRNHEMWMLEVSVFDYDVGYGDGQEVVEEVLESCGLPGMRELSEIANKNVATPFYEEKIFGNKKSKGDEAVKDTDQGNPVCRFVAWVDEDHFQHLFLGDMAQSPRRKQLGFAYVTDEPIGPEWDRPFELP